MKLDAFELHQLRKIGVGDLVFMDVHTIFKFRVFGLVTGSDDKPRLTKSGWLYANTVSQADTGRKPSE